MNITFFKYIFLALPLSAMIFLFSGCKPFVKLQYFYNDNKKEDLTKYKGANVHVMDVTFIDWTYPKEEQLMKFYPDSKEMIAFSYKAFKYHGCVFEYYYNKKKYKFLAMVPRSWNMTVNKIKGLYVSKNDVMIHMTYVATFPKEMWKFPQKQWPEMPVFLLKSIF